MKNMRHNILKIFYNLYYDFYYYYIIHFFIIIKKHNITIYTFVCTISNIYIKLNIGKLQDGQVLLSSATQQIK